MGHKIYGEEEPKSSRIVAFCENFFAAFMAFSGCIGGWLVHFGMPIYWMLAATIMAALVMARHLSKSE